LTVRTLTISVGGVVKDRSSRGRRTLADRRDLIILRSIDCKISDRFPSIAAAVHRLAAKDAVIDSEFGSCDEAGKPDFYALMRRRSVGLCVWCFDLLTLNGRDLRSEALKQRKAKLEVLLRTTEDTTLPLSHTFADGEKLLHAAAQQGLEGIVSKRRAGIYLPGASDWIKVKTTEWREANRERYKMFERT
jgi:ATP-dependent DNA ligase